LPPLTPDGDTIPDIYRKQALRLEELDRENRRLEREVRDGEARWRKSEEELEELREASGESEVLRAQEMKRKVEEREREIQKLREEVKALTRQQSVQMQRSGSHSYPATKSTARRGSNGMDVLGGASPDSWRKELENKDSTIADMELEISRLRGQLSSQTAGCETHGEQIEALKGSLSSVQGQLGSKEAELGDLKKAMQRASEKSVLDGTERMSKDTKIRALERELAEAVEKREEVVKKAEMLEKKVETMNKLHRETEGRNASRLAAVEAQGREAGMLKARLAKVENENLKLREERDRRKKRDIMGEGADEGLEELEDEARVRLEKKIRELEGENFDLRRGVWREKRKDLQPSVAEVDADGAEIQASEGFDEVDLSGHGPGSRRRSFATQHEPHQQKHSSFSTVLNSGLAAFRATTASPAQQQQHSRPRQDSLLQEFDDDIGGGDGFDEEEFARAQREEEARKMVEHVREVKRKLNDWQGWRLDLVDVRRGGGGIGIGEIFEV
jgi:chromosome segregation ATPase